MDDNGRDKILDRAWKEAEAFVKGYREYVGPDAPDMVELLQSEAKDWRKEGTPMALVYCLALHHAADRITDAQNPAVPTYSGHPLGSEEERTELAIRLREEQRGPLRQLFSALRERARCGLAHDDRDHDDYSR